MADLPPLHPSTRQPESLRKQAALNASMQQQGINNPGFTHHIPSKIDLSVSWDKYFDQQRIIECPSRGIKFNVYSAGSGSSSSSSSPPPLVLCLHGGGYTGLSWSLVAKILSQEPHNCHVVAPDLRGHGLTQSVDESDLSTATLAADIVALWETLLTTESTQTILVGHSMGGSAIVWAAALASSKSDITSTSLAGVVVIDVVEGTALSSLPHMMNVLRSRPRSFNSLQDSVMWGLSSGTVRNAEAAAISLPSQLVLDDERCFKTKGSSRNPSHTLDDILEDQEEDDDQQQSMFHKQKEEQQPRATTTRSWRWRTKLETTAEYWQGWFQGLSEAFLNLSVPKVLILAGTDRLDKTLMVGQMQGKFQLSVLPQAGHAVHEDLPDKTAEIISTFMKRFKILK